MSKQDEAATWDDMDWGGLGPAESLLESPAPPPEPVRKPTPPPLPVADAAPPVDPDPVPIPAPSKSAEAPPQTPPPNHGPSIESRVHVPATVASLALAGADGGDAVVRFDREFTVGRHPGNDLVIRDRQVSGHHAKLVLREDGTFELIDLDSSGGTFVNGEEVRQRVLANGDRIEFSSIVARFHYVAGRHVHVEEEFEETLVFRRPKPSQPIPQKAPARRVGTLAMPLADGGRSLLPLAEGEVSIGRAEDNDFVIANGHVSGHHAKIVATGPGEFEILDLDSTCGTLVNGLSIIQAPLSDGDRITFGSVECLFEIREE